MLLLEISSQYVTVSYMYFINYTIYFHTVILL